MINLKRQTKRTPTYCLSYKECYGLSSTVNCTVLLKCTLLYYNAIPLDLSLFGFKLEKALKLKESLEFIIGLNIAFGLCYYG